MSINVIKEGNLLSVVESSEPISWPVKHSRDSVLDSF